MCNSVVGIVARRGAAPWTAPIPTSHAWSFRVKTPSSTSRSRTACEMLPAPDRRRLHERSIWASRLHEIANQCERMADHCTNIAEQVIYDGDRHDRPPHRSQDGSTSTTEPRTRFQSLGIAGRGHSCPKHDSPPDHRHTHAADTANAAIDRHTVSTSSTVVNGTGAQPKRTTPVQRDPEQPMSMRRAVQARPRAQHTGLLLQKHRQHVAASIDVMHDRHHRHPAALIEAGAPQSPSMASRRSTSAAVAIPLFVRRDFIDACALEASATPSPAAPRSRSCIQRA